MKILSIDYGTKLIGLAIGERELKIPKAIPPLSKTSKEKTINEIKKIIFEEKINLILLGIPEVNEPEKSWIYKKVFSFGLLLKKNLQIPIVLFNERDTTIEAKKRYKKRGYNIHSSSSLILLERFFDLK